MAKDADKRWLVPWGTRAPVRHVRAPGQL